MIEMLQIKSACNKVLRETFPDMKIYGSDSSEGLERPCFYTEIVPYSLNYESVNLVYQRCGFKISILEKTPDEAFQLKTFAKIRKAFGMKLSVENRLLQITDMDFATTGSGNDVFQVTAAIEWYDSVAEDDNRPLMEKLNITQDLR